MTSQQLLDILLQAKPYQPRALGLMRQHQAGQVATITQRDRMRAFGEMRSYVERCNSMTKKLSDLQSRPVGDVSPEVVGFYL